MDTIDFLTCTGKTWTPLLRQKFIHLSDLLGVSAVVGASNNYAVRTATESSVLGLGPYFADGASDGQFYPHLLRLSPSALCPSLVSRYVHSSALRVNHTEREMGNRRQG